MTASKYAYHVSTVATPQTEQIPGRTDQVQNSAGGFVFAVDDWTRLERFLILGNEGGSYYATERKMTIDNASCVRRCAAADIDRTVKTIVDISVQGRAPKNDPAIFALAMIAGMKDIPQYATKALSALNQVCRIGTHLFQFVECVQNFRGWGRSLKRAVGQWYTTKEPRDLAYQVSKYQQRNGWSHRDVLRLAKPVTTGEIASVLRWAVGKPHECTQGPIIAFERAKAATTAAEIVKLIQDYDLVRECVPTQFLNEPAVWEALLEKMPLNAMVRNLGKMSAIGLLKPLSQASLKVSERLRNPEFVKRSRMHPLAVLMAQRTYASGRGVKGSLTWTVDNNTRDALDDAFYLAFDAIEPCGKRFLLGLDVSGSMGSGSVGGSSLTPREASAAMALVTMKTEPMTHCFGFSDTFVPLSISKNMRFDDAVQAVSGLMFSSTDCSLPMLYAMKNGLEVDTFVVYTDSETYAGGIHPNQAIQQYRNKTGINAKLIVVGMVANEFTIADPTDAGMLDCVGFDTTTPAVMADFARS